MNTRPPYSYDIVGSFLRKPAIVTARKEFSEGKINAQQLKTVEDQSIRELVADEKRVGLRAVTDGEFRRAFWHLDFLAALKGVEEVKAEHFSVAFQGFQPKSQTLKIVDKVDFPEDHPEPLQVPQLHCGKCHRQAVHSLSFHAAPDLLCAHRGLYAHPPL